MEQRCLTVRRDVNRTERSIALYSAEQLFTLFDLPRRAISEHAKFGVWMAGPASLALDGTSVSFNSSGRRLTIRLDKDSHPVSD